VDAIRFGSFFGAFSFLWKLVNNGLKLHRGKDDRINGAIAGKGRHATNQPQRDHHPIPHYVHTTN
jgi:hypothetical protein